MDKNSLIGYLAIIVIVVSILSFLIPNLTGRVTDTGQVNVTITAVTSINFTTELVEFGSGQVSAGQSSATVDTRGTSTGGTWASPNDNLTIENIGNTNVTLQLATGKNNQTFLGGTNPTYQYLIYTLEYGGCTNTTININTTWYEVNDTAPGTTICNPLQFNDSKDAVEVAIKLVIPSDAANGTKTDTFTATATAAP